MAVGEEIAQKGKETQEPPVLPTSVPNIAVAIRLPSCIAFLIKTLRRNAPYHLLVYVYRVKRASNFGIGTNQVPLESMILPMLCECVTWVVKLKVFVRNALLINCQRWLFHGRYKVLRVVGESQRANWDRSGCPDQYALLIILGRARRTLKARILDKRRVEELAVGNSRKAVPCRAIVTNGAA